MARDILIVDDEADIRLMLSGILEDEGFATREAANSDEALAALRERSPSLVILDIWLERSLLDGLQVLEVIKRERPSPPVVMISGHGNVETAVQAIKQGAYDFIEKPFKADRLLLIVERAIEAARLRREVRELKTAASPIDDLDGASAAIAQVRQAVDKVASSGSRVLIEGPAGAGKEVIARMIHRKSHRADGPFVVVNCAAMHPERMESELFGSDGFRGDKPHKVGFFEQADGGTLLLDEVADMPVETQSKIAHVLQDQTFEKIGGGARIALDARVVATTTRNLRDAIRVGEFREDLYYRLSVVPLRIPPLRERREDIPALVGALMARAAQTNGAPLRIIGEDAMATLQGYDWPGNVRQLRNVIDWLLIMAPGDAKVAIRADMLPAEIGSAAPEVMRLENSSEIMSLSLREARDLFEREYLLAQVTRFSGNISRTAEFVGMERSALHRKLKSLGVTGGGGGRA